MLHQCSLVLLESNIDSRNEQRLFLKARVDRLLKHERPIGSLKELRLESALIGRELVKPKQSTTFKRADIREGTPSDESRLPFAAWEIPVVEK